jgi:hypothetical protein
MDDWSRYEQERAREDAEIANIPNKVQRIGHMLLTNRALATALLQMHSDHAKYADVCEFLDKRVRVMVEKAISIRVPEEPSFAHDDDDDIEEEDYPPPWEGDPEATCYGKTQKGDACTKRGAYSHEGTAYCAKHFPHST